MKNNCDKTLENLVNASKELVFSFADLIKVNVGAICDAIKEETQQYDQGCKGREANSKDVLPRSGKR